MFSIKWLNIQKPRDCSGETLIEVNKIAKLILVCYSLLFRENVRERFLDPNYDLGGNR